MPVQEAKLLEGKILAAEIQSSVRADLEKLKTQNRVLPGLVVLQANQDPSSSWYINQQEKLASKLGIPFKKIGPDVLQSQDGLIEAVRKYSSDAECHGIFVAMPLPSGFAADEILMQMDPRKDVEGVHPASLGLMVLRRTKLIPPTAFAAYQLIQAAGLALRGKKAVIVGQSPIVGRPLQLLLGEERMTTTVCNTGTSAADLQQAVSESDVVIACAGKPGVIEGSWIKPGAVVIDVGTTEVNGKLTGDVQFEEAKKKAGFITPVPGGVGPLTVTMLMLNLMHAYQWQKGI